MSLLPLQAPAAAFESESAYFSAAEWENLEEWQRELYKTVLRGKNEPLVSLGKDRWARSPQCLVPAQPAAAPSLDPTGFSPLG